MKELIFFGDDAYIYDFPEDIKIFYAKEPLEPISNNEKAIRDAINNPIGSKKIQELVDKDSQIAICFDDISVPLPPMKNEVRARAATVVLDLLTNLGVKKENIFFICATGLHRKCTSKEFIHLLGKKIYKEFSEQIVNHDASDEESLKSLAKMENGYEVKINKLAAEADLIIYLNVTFTPLNGGWKSIIVGLGSYETIKPHHSPEILSEGSFMDPKNSGLHRIIWDMGEEIRNKIQVFTIEMVLNNNFFSGFFKKMYAPLKNNNNKPSLLQKVLLSLAKITPKFLKARMRKNLKADYGLIGIFAGDIEKAHNQSMNLLEKQILTPIDRQYDIIVYGAPNLTPYNVGAEMNPLLLHTLVLGYLYNMHKGISPLKKNGIIIVSNPAYEKFDTQQHPSYKDFYYDILSSDLDMFSLKSEELVYRNNPTYISKYRSNFAYHGTHAFMVYYWGALGEKNVGEVIVSGAKNKDTLLNLGFRYASDLDEAIEMSRKKMGKNCAIAYFCIPPVFIGQVSKM
ncbi:MAG: DUF2088 domain-containing protein [Candidatus Lokiarchaeota archaeon]|nr:DUF2088 domain-containing protein [Candidatus Lokiarchaeota archaeon]MBD3337788.1 DUF2088 domain-containing protein [Candidatus Lokiarchaeota archaeon]